MNETTSYWRCDSCGETYTVTLAPVLLDGETHEYVGEAPAGTDFVISDLPCTICGHAMRRVVSALDLREWGADIVGGAA